MIRFFNLLSFVSSIRPQLGTHCVHAGKKTLNFESLEARQMMHGAGCQIQAPIVSSEAPIATAMTLAEFTAETGIVIDEGVVMSLPVLGGDSQITQVDRPDLIGTAASSELETTPPLFTPEKGDANSDGFVNEEDLGAWEANFTGDLGGNLSIPAKLFEEGDFDGDGDVDLNDLGEWAAHYTGPVNNEDVTDPVPALADDSENSADEGSTSDSALIEYSDFVTFPIDKGSVVEVIDFPGFVILESSFTLNVGIVLGDADGDSDVDNGDLAAWDVNFTGDLGGGPGTSYAQGDFDSDGDTDLNDLGIWAENYTGPIVPLDESAGESVETALAVSDNLPATDDLTPPPVNPFSAALEQSVELIVKLGDADADGDVDDDDSAIWTANFTGDLGGSESATMTFAQGDFDSDGDVDLNDLGLWAENYTGPIEIGGV